MSDRPCNLCEYRRLKYRETHREFRLVPHEGGQKVQARLRGDPDADWEDRGIWYMEVPETCAC